MPITNLGKKFPEKWRKKISKALKAKYKKGELKGVFTKGHKINNGRTPHNKGIKGRFKNQNIEGLKIGHGWNRGKPAPWANPPHEKGEDSSNWKGGKPNCLDCGKMISKRGFIRCIHCSGKFRSGEKNPAWLGGKSFEPYTINWTETLKRSIRERDRYLCDICKLYGIDVHHIDYNKKNCSPNNLVTLCRRCHLKTNMNRSYWQNYFQNKSL